MSDRTDSSECSQASRREFLALGAALCGSTALPVMASPSLVSRNHARTATSNLHSTVRHATASTTHRGRPGEITLRTIEEAERLAGVSFTEAHRTTLLQTIGQQLARYEQRQGHPFLPNALAPAQTFDPRLPWMRFDHLEDAVLRTMADPGPLPERDEDIAFAPVTKLSKWIQRRELTSRRLTEIYLARLKQYDAVLECVITLTEGVARAQADRADQEILAGHYRGPLHGIPYGAKDLLDTAGIATTWGASTYIDRVPDDDAAVIAMLEEAGAVLVAKLALGEIAYNDIWFGGRTNNPWNPEEGSSGSSAGSAAAIAVGLVGFSIGTETYGSIVSPSMKCGVTGLRPTFGRVSRQGAMALCWSLDKIGPMCRTVEDCMLVLDAISDYDEADPSSIDLPLQFDAMQRVQGLRIGWHPAWFADAESHALDEIVLATCRALGMQLVQIEFDALPYESMLSILHCEAAAAFEELTRTGLDEALVWQDPIAWPNIWRQSWFIPGVELVQAERVRRQAMEMLADRFEHVDAIISPSFAANMLLITNMTGHPSLTLRTGFKDPRTPYGITIIGNLFDEGTLCSIGMALERELDVWHIRPPMEDLAE